MNREAGISDHPDWGRHLTMLPEQEQQAPRLALPAQAELPERALQALLLSSRARRPVREQRPVEQALQEPPPSSPVPERVPALKQLHRPASATRRPEVSELLQIQTSSRRPEAWPSCPAQLRSSEPEQAPKRRACLLAYSVTGMRQLPQRHRS